MASLATKRHSIAQQIQRIQRHSTANSVWQAFASRTTQGKFCLASVAKMEQCLGGGLLSLSLSRCSHFLASLWAKFKGLFYSFYHNFILSCRKFFLFHRSFNSSFCLQKAFFRAFCLFEIFKRCVCALLRPFCHFEPLQKGDPTGCKAQAAAKKSTKIKRKLAILGYFACTQYDKFGLLSKNNGYFYSNFKAKTQIFYSKFKAFYKFKSFDKFKAFYIFISNFKPYTRLFHIFTPSFAQCKLINFNTRRKNGR